MNAALRVTSRLLAGFDQAVAVAQGAAQAEVDGPRAGLAAVVEQLTGRTMLIVD
ncbi:hypothetical protein [Pseudomonas citronellolis]|uniref:hypothetical protein n=1 Tax=Pseudomonas citronellolis TaxID=53408 RepID=UPI0023E3BE7A|nr:hypothetical protein [Pseudomonas citronellolis]MDF3935160.1 hypothetical protein [Pseudomonas citronellolis]